MSDTLPPITDHAFARLIKARCEDMSRSMAEIAAEVGATPDELCRWIMRYQEPKPSQPVKRGGPAIAAPDTVVRDRWSMSQNAQRMAAWRKQHEGAAATRLKLEASKP